MVEDRNLFRDSSSPNLTSVSLEVILGAKNKQKGSGEVITEVITSNTQGNSWVISQQVLFFNSFKLGTRSKKNQVFSNEEELTSNLAFKGGEKNNFSLLIGKCSIPLLNGN